MLLCDWCTRVTTNPPNPPAPASEEGVRRALRGCSPAVSRTHAAASPRQGELAHEDMQSAITASGADCIQGRKWRHRWCRGGRLLVPSSRAPGKIPATCVLTATSVNWQPAAASPTAQPLGQEHCSGAWRPPAVRRELLRAEQSFSCGNGAPPEYAGHGSSDLPPPAWDSFRHR